MKISQTREVPHGNETAPFAHGGDDVVVRGAIQFHDAKAIAEIASGTGCDQGRAATSLIRGASGCRAGALEWSTPDTLGPRLEPAFLMISVCLSRPHTRKSLALAEPTNFSHSLHVSWDLQ